MWNVDDFLGPLLGRRRRADVQAAGACGRERAARTHDGRVGMPDEACPTFPAMLDNLYEGHQWISSRFNSVCFLQHLTVIRNAIGYISECIDRRSIIISTV